MKARPRGRSCGIWALAFALHHTYEDVLIAAAALVPDWRDGLGEYEMRQVAQRLGHKLDRVHWRRVDPDTMAGVLAVNWNRPKDHDAPGHWVVLREGVIVDPADPSVSDADDYLREWNGRVGTLLVEVE